MSSNGMFHPATKRRAKLRLAISGLSGGGKTYTALAIATALGKRVAVADTEHGSASLYSDLFKFDVVELASHHPNQYMEIIRAASQDYDVLVIDSLSHAWNGTGGVLEIVDQFTNKFGSGWRTASPLHNKLIHSILAAPIHVIVTMRSKMAYEVEKNDKGKVQIKKVGLQPIQREGTEYEFTLVGDMDMSHNMTIMKSRCLVVPVNATISKPGSEFANTLLDWLEEGEAGPSDEQTKEFDRLIHEKGFSDSARDTALAARGVTRFDDLTAEKAEEILVALRGRPTNGAAKAEPSTATAEQEVVEA